MKRILSKLRCHQCGQHEFEIRGRHFGFLELTALVLLALTLFGLPIVLLWWAVNRQTTKCVSCGQRVRNFTMEGSTV